MLDGQINYNEGWNAYRQRAASLSLPLYGAVPGFSVTNYPPVSFHLVGQIGRLCGDVVLAGRLTSLVAIAMIALVVARIGRCLSGSPAVAACCALCWLAGIELWTPERVGADDPQLLAMAMQAGALLVFLRRPVRCDAVAVAATLVSLSLFTKQNLLALPLGMTLSLAAVGAWRALLVWMLTGLASCITLLAASTAFDGPSFLSHVLAPRAFFPDQAMAMSAFYMLSTAPCLVVVASWIVREGRSAVALPLALAWFASLLEIVVFAGGDGVAGNIFQDAILMNALLQPVAVHAVLSGRRSSSTGSTSAMLAMASLLVVPLPLAMRIPGTWHRWQVMSEHQADVRQGVSLLHERPGPVACENLLLCYRAGKPSVFDPYYVLDQIKLGRLPARSIDDLVERQVIGAIEIGSAEDPETADAAYLPWRFTHSFMTVLWTHYRPVLITSEFTIFVPLVTADDLRQKGAIAPPIAR